MPAIPSPLATGPICTTLRKAPLATSWTNCRKESRKSGASRSAPIAACASAWSSIRSGRPKCISKGRPRGTTRSHATITDPRAVLNALERLANGCGSESPRVRQDLSIAEGQLRDYQARLGKPFQHDQYLFELTELRDQLKAGLSASAQARGDEARQAVAGIAERIKALKAAHSIEAAPQRIRQKHATAEEPVTARIRRRKEAVPAADAVIQPEAAASPSGTSQLPESTAQASSIKPQMTFQECLASERRNAHLPENEPTRS